MKMICATKLRYSYVGKGSSMLALRDLSFSVETGEFVTLLGRNGSGKSTLARHLNALIPLQEGSLTVAGIDAADPSRIWELRRSCGMVFQNPDHQFVSSLISEDIAFGLENYGVPEEEIPDRMRMALETVGMAGYEQRCPQLLSGGQKQRIALAGILALEPDLIVLDEATSMLDPQGRREMLDTVERLHREKGKTIFMITHYIEEAVFSDRVLLMQQGEIIADGSPREILTQPSLLKKAGLLPPFPVKVWSELQAAGMHLAHCPLTEEEMVEELCRSLSKR